MNKSNKSIKLYIYVLEDPDKPNKSKVGITKNPDQRLKSYRTAAPQARWIYLRQIDFKHHEREVIDMLKGSFRVDREMIHAPAKIVANSVDGYFLDQDEQSAC